MERPKGLADLKLVNKYYPPVGVANYSYPSPKLDSMCPCEHLVGRSSMGSEASVPDMVDDRESITSSEEDNKSFYHFSGADLWDKFWEDPFWEANAEEAVREADGITQRITNRNASYPALLSSLDESFPKTQHPISHQKTTFVPEAELSYRWPLAVAKPPTSPRPVTPKVSYSLFPRQTPTPPAVLSLSPRRPSITPPSTSLWASPGFNDSSTSLNSLGRSSMMRKTRSDVPLAKGRSSWTDSAATISMPGTVIPSPPGFRVSARRGSSQSINLKQRFPVRPTRSRSDTLTSQTSLISAPQHSTTPAHRSPIVEKSVENMPLPPPIATLFPLPPCSPRTFTERHSQPEAHKLPPPLPLQRCTTETEMPSSRPRHGGITSHVYPATNPSTPVMPTHQEAAPMPVSFFEVDSDSDEEEEETRSFARRLARTFTSQVRARSASANPRSRKGHEVAKQQLRRARAETVGSPSEEVPPVAASPASVPLVDEGKASASSRTPPLRKQKSEVFGRIFWNRR